MPPKRDTSSSTAEPPVKMIKIEAHGQAFVCDPLEEKCDPAEESRYSPLLNHEPGSLDFDEEDLASSGLRTDTVSLLMKIDQLQAQLRYERRCRILAERELKELKEMNSLMMQMRHTAHELRVTLDNVLQGEEASVAPLNSDECVSFLAEAEMGAVHNLPEDDLDFLYLAENLRVPKKLYERIAQIADYKKYTSALLLLFFDRETLATHSIHGRRNTFMGEDCHKPQLPPEILKSIIGHINEKFGVDHSQIKTVIRTKLNNEDKLLKKRLGLGKSEPKNVTDQKFCPDAALLPENGAMSSESHS